MKKVFLNLWMLFAMSISILMFNSCSKDDDPVKETTTSINPTYDEGVIINGVKWATRNVSGPGRFANKPEYAGMFYQWNNKTGWAATGDVTDWNNNASVGNVWEKVNDPSPAGWRVPTLDEIKSLLDSDNVSNEWVIENGINGRRFVDKNTGNSIFMPAVGYRDYSIGKLNNATFSGRYWCSKQSERSTAYFLDFDSYGVECTGYYYRTNAFSIRCVAEE